LDNVIFIVDFVYLLSSLIEVIR